MRYSPLTQITPENVSRLQVAWVYHMKPAPAAPSPDAGAPAPGGRGRGRGGSGFSASEATPIVAGGLMYIATPYNRVVAVEPTTGRERWVYQLPTGSPSTRGVEYWPGDATTPAQVVFGSSAGQLYSVDARTGKPNDAFGDHGIVNLNTPEILRGLPGSDGLSSPPAIYRNLVITGGRTQENPPRGPAGDVRAWDLHTGALVWTFHSVPAAGEKFSETWAGESGKNRSGVNVWGFITVDVPRGIV
jgi:quinoprotein glucose dehydrogenase